MKRIAASLAVRMLVKNAQSQLAQRGIRPAPVEKAGVPAFDTGDLGVIGAAQSLMPLVEDAMVLTNIPGARQVPVLTRVLTVNGGAVGFPVADRKAIRAVPVSLDLAGIEYRKFEALTVATNDSILNGGPVFEAGLQNDMVHGLALVVNQNVLSDNAASDAVPAGLGFGVTPINATSDLAADIRNLIESMGSNSDVSSWCFVTDPQTAARIGTATDANGGLLFPNVGVTGGELLGVPVLVTRGSVVSGSPSSGSLWLIDGSGIQYAMEGLEVSTSENATIEMADDPTGAGDTPAPMSKQQVSMFQSELTAFKAIIRATWKRARSGAVAVLEGI